jgi:hypothetical protein
MKIWWLNDSNVHTKEQFETHITMNVNDIKFENQLPINHPLNKGSVLNLEIPTFSQAFRWFREKYELFHSTNYQDDNSGPGCFDYEICDKRGKSQCGDDDSEFSTYEEVELACLQKLIEIAKTK